MDLKNTQGRQILPSVAEYKENPESASRPASLDKPDDPIDIPDKRAIPEEKIELYGLRNKTIRCTVFEQHRAYLKCPLCPEYTTCAQLKREQRIELESSPFFSIKELVWEGPRRIKTMYIAVCTDGTLRRLDNFDPKNNDGMNPDEFKDVEEVLVVTKAFRRKVVWAPVSLEQVKADQVNGGKPKEAEKLINEDGNSAPEKQKAGKSSGKAKNGRKN